jgi:23S rRNA pseudouridine2605 synthase
MPQAPRSKPSRNPPVASKPVVSKPVVSQAKRDMAETSESMRIAKAMARSGLCSRRDAERWIEQGRVTLNGSVLTTPAVTVGPSDKIEVDGQPMRKPEAARLWRYHKPRGRVTTHKDPEGRPTVFEALPEDMPRVVSIGRLDFNTEGLLLLTTNGALARHLELPATGWLRRYRVRAHGTVTPEQLASLRDGLEVDGVHYGPIEAALDRQQGANVWLTIGLREGKNREVRKILATLQLEVTRLIRLSFGPFALGGIEPGAVEEVPQRALAEQIGAKIAEELGLRYARVVDERPRGKDARPPLPQDKTPPGGSASDRRMERPLARESGPRQGKGTPAERGSAKDGGAGAALGMAHGRRAHHQAQKLGGQKAGAQKPGSQKSWTPKAGGQNPGAHKKPLK